MRCQRCIPALILLGTSLITSAQQRNQTDAQRDGFAGPVKSVSSHVTQTGIKWDQPGGPTLLIPVWCKQCEYDSDGTKTKSGDLVDGIFAGSTIRLVRNGDGQVTERFIMDAR